MLETKLEELKAELSELRAVIVELTAAMQAAPAQQVEKKAKAEKPKVDAKADPEPEVDAVSRDDLQDLCMTIVRKDRSKKAAVKDAITAFGNASTLKDVAESDLAALKNSLEALK